MKNFFFPKYPKYSTGGNFWLLLLRVSASAFMVTHGYPKLMKLLNGNTEFVDLFGIGNTATLVLAIIGEFVCPILVILGVWTRLASLMVIITMGVAAFHVHLDDPFKNKEMSLLYLLVFFTVFVFGPGKFSLDPGSKR